MSYAPEATWQGAVGHDPCDIHTNSGTEGRRRLARRRRSSPHFKGIEGHGQSGGRRFSGVRRSRNLNSHSFKDKYENALRALVKRKAAGKMKMYEEKGDGDDRFDGCTEAKFGRRRTAKSAPKASQGARVHRGPKRGSRHVKKSIEAMESSLGRYRPTGEQWQYNRNGMAFVASWCASADTVELYC